MYTVSIYSVELWSVHCAPTGHLSIDASSARTPASLGKAFCPRVIRVTGDSATFPLCSQRGQSLLHIPGTPRLVILQ